MIRMQEINERYLAKVAELYDIEKIEFLDNSFSCYRLIEKTFFKIDIHLFLTNDYSIKHDLYTVLEQLTEWEKNQKPKHGNSYLGIMTVANPNIEMTVWMNGQSLSHFVLFDEVRQCLVFDQIWYYTDTKRIRKLREIYQSCFNELNDIAKKYKIVCGKILDRGCSDSHELLQELKEIYHTLEKGHDKAFLLEFLSSDKGIIRALTAVFCLRLHIYTKEAIKVLKIISKSRDDIGLADKAKIILKKRKREKLIFEDLF